jgi:hypothetical protein
LAECLSGTGPLRTSDLHALPNRLSRDYLIAIPLAKLVLNGGDISTSFGPYRGTAFLIRTPELIEDGLRSALKQSLPAESILKRSLSLGDSTVSINPDLVFEGRSAVGDVKYRPMTRSWDRGDFNQAVTFATGFHAARCAVIGFIERAAQPIPPTVKVGAIEVKAFSWIADPAVDPHESLTRLAHQLQQWLCSHPALPCAV